MSRHGTVRLRVFCPRRERGCHVRLRLLRGRATIASKTRDVPGGAARTFTLKLSRSARRALVQSHLLRVRAVATVRTRAGHRGTTRTSILLQAPRRA